MTMQQQIKIRLLENKIKNTNDIIIKKAIQKRVKQLKLQSRLDILCKIHI